MAQTETRPERTPPPASQNIELRQPAVTEDAHKATTQQRTSLPATQTAEPKRRTITEDDVRLRAYTIYLKRGDNTGDEVSDWIQAERELQEN